MLVQLDALPSGQVIINTDDIVAIVNTDIGVEIVLRNTEHRVFVPHKDVLSVSEDLDDPENRVLRNNVPPA